MPWTTLCRADWVRDDLVVPCAGGCYATTQFLWELREAMRSLMGLAKERLRIDQPTIAVRLTPSSDAYSLPFACDCAFVVQLIAMQTRA